MHYLHRNLFSKHEQCVWISSIDTAAAIILTGSQAHCLRNSDMESVSPWNPRINELCYIRVLHSQLHIHTPYSIEKRYSIQSLLSGKACPDRDTLWALLKCDCMSRRAIVKCDLHLLYSPDNVNVNVSATGVTVAPSCHSLVPHHCLEVTVKDNKNQHSSELLVVIYSCESSRELFCSSVVDEHTCALTHNHDSVMQVRLNHNTNPPLPLCSLSIKMAPYLGWAWSIRLLSSSKGTEWVGVYGGHKVQVSRPFLLRGIFFSNLTVFVLSFHLCFQSVCFELFMEDTKDSVIVLLFGNVEVSFLCTWEK